MPQLDEELQEKYEGVIKGIRKDALDNIGFYAQSLYTAAANNNGIVDIDNPAFKDAIDRSLGKVEEKKGEGTEEQKSKEQIGKDGYSVEGVLYSAEKAIEKLKKAGVPEENFEEIREELKKYKEDVGNKMSSKEGVTSLINDYIKNTGVINSIGIVDENSNFIPDKGDIVKKVGANLKLPEEVLNAGLKRIDLISPLHKGINKHMAQCFAIEGQQENPVWCVLDRTKLTPENIEKFTKLVNHDIKAFSAIQETFKEIGITDIEQNKKFTQALLPSISKLNPEEMQEKGKEIVKNFAPLLESKNEKLAKSTESALAKLDSGYLSEYSAVIAAELKTVNEKGTSLWEKFKSVFTNTDYLAERLEKVTDNYVVKNDEYVEKEINNKIFLNTVKDTEIATGLTKFIEENRTKIVNSKTSNLINSKSSNLEPLIPDAFNRVVITAKDKLPEGIRENDIVHELKKVNLAELRKVNPVGFDKALFGQAPSYDKIPPPPPLPEVTREVVPPQKSITPTKTPISKVQEVLANRERSQKTEGGRTP